MRLRGRILDLTYKEFELLKYLAQHPGRVFTRSQLLQEVWGYDYFGGTRTVDVHVRRLRAKLGTDYEVLIGTVRNVGYRFVPEVADSFSRSSPDVARTERPEVDDRTASALRALWRQAADVDGVEAVSEAFRLAVGPPRDAVVHLLRWAGDGTLVGYAQVAGRGHAGPWPSSSSTLPTAAEATDGPCSTRSSTRARAASGRTALPAADASPARPGWR